MFVKYLTLDYIHDIASPVKFYSYVACLFTVL